MSTEVRKKSKLVRKLLICWVILLVAAVGICWHGHRQFIFARSNLRSEIRAYEKQVARKTTADLVGLLQPYISQEPNGGLDQRVVDILGAGRVCRDVFTRGGDSFKGFIDCLRALAGDPLWLKDQRRAVALKICAIEDHFRRLNDLEDQVLLATSYADLEKARQELEKLKQGVVEVS